LVPSRARISSTRARPPSVDATVRCLAGLSHLADAESKMMKDVVGTLAYIAPESARERLVACGAPRTPRPLSLDALCATAVLRIQDGGDTPYSQQCDIWSMGVILYIILSGKAPFKSKDEEKLQIDIKKGNYSAHRPPRAPRPTPALTRAPPPQTSLPSRGCL
jgi:serine/threonine protein kinase